MLLRRRPARAAYFSSVRPLGDPRKLQARAPSQQATALACGLRAYGCRASLNRRVLGGYFWNGPDGPSWGFSAGPQPFVGQLKRHQMLLLMLQRKQNAGPTGCYLALQTYRTFHDAPQEKPQQKQLQQQQQQQRRQQQQEQKQQQQHQPNQQQRQQQQLKQQLQQEGLRQQAQPQQQGQEEGQKLPDDGCGMCPSVRLSRIVLLNKVTRFEVSLAEKMKMWRQQHLSGCSSASSSSSEGPAVKVGGVEATAGGAASAAAVAKAAPAADLYTPGSRAYEAAAAAAEAAAAAALARDYPTAYRTHLLHQQAAAELYRQLREDYGLHVTLIKARTIQGQKLSRRGDVALPPDAIISAGGDGTYLEAASIIPGHLEGSPKGPWIFGVNTDPTRSEGRLCVKPSKQSKQQQQQQELQQPLQKKGHEERQRQGEKSQQEHECHEQQKLKLQEQEYLEGQQQQQQQQQQHLAPALGHPLKFRTPRVPSRGMPSPAAGSSAARCGSPLLAAALAPPSGASAAAVAEGLESEELDVKGYVAATLQHLLQGGALLVSRQRIRVTLRFPQHMQNEVMERLSAIRPEVTSGINTRSSSSSSTGGNFGWPPKDDGGLSYRGSSLETPWLEGTAAEGAGAAGGSPTTAANGSAAAGPLLPSRRRVGGPSVGVAAEGLTFDTAAVDIGGATFSAGAAAAGGAAGGAGSGENVVELRLPFLSVNDVFVSDVNVAKTLYADLWIDGETKRHKSSGVLVSTGTGSTAWNYNMGAVGKQQAKAIVDQVLSLRPKIKGDMEGPLSDAELQKIVQKANEQLLLDPAAPLMRFLVREPIDNRYIECA
ncbi:hypothetical protein, conserved [Eimeria necatrix]|uniref:NAD(+) kinase n=1 Tax=Eimeria necatrix TaxID=51315 RepID=U6N359_9EIME|nr:hypothetical protein, conserved [Eimeria necatrix]CDJ69739.1 hypothetical protein, conserved [Eimeria necatrix]